MRRLLVYLVLMASGFVVGCESADNTEATRTEIQGLVKQFAEAAQKDVNAMLAMYDQGLPRSPMARSSVAWNQSERQWMKTWWEPRAR
jgi:hypothetical protein